MANNELKPAQRVALARSPERPGTAEFVSALFTDFFEQRGDRCCMDDGAIYGGVGLFHGRPVTVIGHRKGHTIEEHVAYHFGMPSPEGYRKAQRLMQQAEKFGRPIVTFIDTAGAYPGLEAEAHGQGEAIASTLALSSRLTVPVIFLSPEGFAAILWKDASRSAEACDVMKLTAADLLELKVIDGVIPEPEGGAQTDPQAVYRALDELLAKELASLSKMSGKALAEARYKKFRMMGANALRKERL